MQRHDPTWLYTRRPGFPITVNSFNRVIPVDEDEVDLALDVFSRIVRKALDETNATARPRLARHMPYYDLTPANSEPSWEQGINSVDQSVRIRVLGKQGHDSAFVHADLDDCFRTGKVRDK